MSINWDLVLKNSKILEKNIENPIFLTFESSQTLMIKLVEFFKEKGNLKEIALSNEELAQKMLEANLCITKLKNRGIKYELQERFALIKDCRSILESHGALIRSDEA